MAKLSQTRSDKKKQNDGVWVPYESGIELLIARFGNTKYDEYVRTEVDSMTTLLRRDLTAQETNEIVKRATAKHILLDWKNVDDDDGKPLSYSPEVGLKILCDEEYRDLYRFISFTAANAQNYRVDALKADAKN